MKSGWGVFVVDEQDELEETEEEFAERIALNYWRTIFLYFKALYLNDDYKRLVLLMKGASNTAQLAALKSQYPNFDRIFLFFDDIHQFGNAITNESIASAFDKFVGQRESYFNIPYVRNFEFILADQAIMPEAGTVYITLPDSTDIEFVKNHYAKAFKKVPADTNVTLADLFLPLEGLLIYAPDQYTLDITAKRLDAYVWMQAEKIDTESAVRRAYESKSAHWASLRKTLDEYELLENISAEDFDQQDLARFKKEMERDCERGIGVIANAIKGYFPSH